MLSILFSIILGYALGNIQFAVLLSKAVAKDDIRNHGSGSAGTTNMLRSFGVKLGVLTFAGDVFKGAVAYVLCRYVLGGTQLGEWCGVLGGIFVIVGHNWPILYRFKGGKGIASSFGVALVINPIVAVILLVVALLTAFITKFMSLGSLLGAILVGLYGLFFQPWPTALLFIAIMVLGIWQHRGNIVKLVHGNENKIFTSAPEVKRRNLK